MRIDRIRRTSAPAQLFFIPRPFEERTGVVDQIADGHRLTTKLTNYHLYNCADWDNLVEIRAPIVIMLPVLFVTRPRRAEGGWEI